MAPLQSGRTVGPHFRQVTTKNLETWIPPKKESSFPIRFEDIGASGLLRWFELKKVYGDSLDEITYIARMHDSLTLQSQILLYGTAFEELGAAIGESINGKSKWPVYGRIENILNDCTMKLFRDSKEVGIAVANTYNAIKHSDFEREGISRSELLATDNLFSVSSLCRAISLLWVGCKLGCSEILIDNIRQDRSISQPIEKWLYI